MFAPKKDNYPEPGKYEYPTYIGEGPKYTFRDKFDADGMKKEKRHKKAYRKKSFPGPGTYNVREGPNGPRYTFSARYRKRSSKSVKVPGVGTYNLRDEKSLQVPSYKFDQEKRTNGNLNKSAMNFPGPGTYKLNAFGMSTVGPKFSFSKTQRLEQKRATTPGPGAYSHKLFVGKEGPMLSFTREKNGHFEPNKNFNPEPGKYFENIRYVPSTAQYSIPRSNRPEVGKMKSRLSTPGPEKYNPNPLLSSTRTSFPSWKIGTSQRDSLCNDTKTPGPGAYSIKNGLFPEGSRYTMSAKTRESKKDQIPGPGKYEIVMVQKGNEPKYSIGKEERGDDMKKVLKDNFPGPGKYTTKDCEMTRPISFPRDKKEKGNKNNFPGPGSYKIPCRFNDINNITREKGIWNPTFKYV